MEFAIRRQLAPLPDERPVEIVERKGLGHPDSICDALAEALSVDLCRFYRQRAGLILHHNVDKALLVGGASRPRFGGGRVLEPMRILLCGRATLAFEGVETPVAEIAERTSQRWLEQNLHALDASRHVAVESLVRAGSSELVDLFRARREAAPALANDTSIGVGYAPLSEVERLVLAVEGGLNSRRTRETDPALGEDVKVMAVRRDDRVRLTIACAMVDGALRDLSDYAKAKARAAEIALEAARRDTSLDVEVEVNAADDLEAERVYLTVTGTSGEAGDDGQAGRGNRANGLITPGREMTIESVAGKNPVSHVGKLYNLAAGLLCERLVAEIPALRAAACRMVSRIGQRIDEPQVVEVGLVGPEPDADLRAQVEAIAREELGGLPRLADALVTGELALDRWPLR